VLQSRGGRTNEGPGHHPAARYPRPRADGAPRRRGCGRGHGKRPSFEELDQDKSGSLTPDEFIAAAQARATERFNRLDADKNGVVTQEELAAAKARWKGRHEHHDAE
jgi:hypothetical protein